MTAAVHTYYQACFLILSIISLSIIFHKSPSLQCSQLSECIRKTKILLVLRPEGNPKNETEHTVEPRACVMPQTVLMPKYFRKKWKPESFRYMCRYERRLARVEDEQQKLVPTPGLHGKTCFIEVVRGRNDNSFTLSKCFPLNSPITLGNASSLLIKNGRSINLEVNFAITPQVLQKLETWKATPPDKVPINVLIFGVDSASRAHVLRSLPKSVDAMKRMDFLGLKGYHSVDGSTLTNFMAFLMGLQRNIVRKTCCKSWSNPFDPCPLIWKNFSNASYITMYMEDGGQSFNWGGQSGFTEQPTDYY